MNTGGYIHSVIYFMYFSNTGSVVAVACSFSLMKYSFSSIKNNLSLVSLAN